ncbi:hypothetical protein MMC27_008322 [Xylographa pallens]|nr:hypothetical protein [Xylographa pallens]
MDPSAYPPQFLAQDRSWEIRNAALAMGILETLFVFLFFLSRHIQKTANGLEIWIMLPAYLFCITHCIMIYCKHAPTEPIVKAVDETDQEKRQLTSLVFIHDAGMGRHVVAVTTNQLILWLKLEVVEEYLYIISVTLPKLCILALYLRIFTTKSYRWAAYGIAGVLILNLITNIILSSLLCQPYAFNWDKTILGGSCIDLIAVYRWVSIPNLVTDMAILALPLPIIWRLHTNRRQKIGLTITFLTGSLGIITAIVRLVSFFDTDLFADPTYNSVTTMTWTLVEPGVYLIASCLPSLRSLSKYFKDAKLSAMYSRLLGYGSRFSSRRSTRDVSLLGDKADMSSSTTGSRARYIPLGEVKQPSHNVNAGLKAGITTSHEFKVDYSRGINREDVEGHAERRG